MYVCSFVAKCYKNLKNVLFLVDLLAYQFISWSTFDLGNLFQTFRGFMVLSEIKFYYGDFIMLFQN